MSEILPRETFLRYLHVVTDAEAPTEALMPEEIALADHDAALRSALAEAESERDRLREALTRFEATLSDEACPDCSVTATATGWTLRRCNRHRIDVRFVSAPLPADAGAAGAKP